MSVARNADQADGLKNNDLANRESALLALASARDLPELFELANRALCERQRWGDDLVSSKAAAQKWAGFFFPVEAIRSGALMSGAHVPRARLLDMSLSAAKAVAGALLEPAPALDEDGAGVGEAERKRRWIEISARAQNAALSALRGAPGCERLMGQHVFGFESLYCDGAKEWERASHAKSWGEVEDKLLTPQEATLGRVCGKSGEAAFRARWEASSPKISNIGALLRESGASFALAGPAGGFGVIAKGASMLRRNCAELSKLTGVPLLATGMGLEGWGLNLSSGSRMAYCDQLLRLAAFGHAPSHLGHEWTHLMDARVQSAGSLAQKSALAALKAAPMKLAADPALVKIRREGLRETALIVLGRCLSRHGREELRERHLTAHPQLPGEWVCDASFLDRVESAARSGRDAFEGLFDEIQGARRAAPKESWVLWLYERIREGIGESASASSVCDFVRQAQVEDQAGYAKEGYFASEKEMIARVAESYFHHKGASPSLAWESEAGLTPRGLEAASLSQSYQALIDAVAAEPELLITDRARERLKKADDKRLRLKAIELGAKDEALESNGALQPSRPKVGVSAWRQNREAPSSIAPLVKKPLARGSKERPASG